MVLERPIGERKHRIINKTIMQYAIEYIDSQNKKKQDLWNINYVRLKKGLLLPCEVVGAKGKLQTSCYLKIEEQSSMQWNFHKNLNSNITKGQKRT